MEGREREAVGSSGLTTSTDGSTTWATNSPRGADKEPVLRGGAGPKCPDPGSPVF